MGVLERLNEVNEARSIDAFGIELSDWRLSQWSNAVAGETGELCNICKKIDRGDYKNDRDKYDAANVALGKEAADVVIYLDLLCKRQGLNLAEEIIKKFNVVSDKRDSIIKL